MKSLIISSAVILFAVQAHAATIAFNLQGTAGSGLLAGNEPGVVSGGSGGEVGAGITFDTTSKLLTINVGWGSSQGFIDLTSASTASHIHVTPSNFGNDGTGNFKQTGGTVFTLTRSSNLATGGVFTNAPIALNATQEADLLNGKYYINVHTSTYGGGEIRGFLVAVPEPAASLLGLVGLASVFSMRRRR